MLRIHANHTNHAVPVNDLAFVTNLFNGCSDFHFILSFVGVGSIVGFT